MRTHLRQPDALALSIARGPVRGETGLEIHHHEDGLSVVVWDDWIPCRELQLHAVIGTVVRLWVERGPIAASAYMAGWKHPQRRR